MMSDDENETLSTREAAKLLGISMRTAQLWVENGALQAWKTHGGHRRILRRSVDNIIKEREDSIMTKANKPLSILIIEDDAAQRDIYQLQIEKWNIEADVTYAKNGYEGLIKIGTLWPQIVLLDLLMPDLNGFELIGALRYQSRLKNSQIIVITVLDEKEVRENGKIHDDIIVLNKHHYEEPLKILLQQFHLRKHN